MKEREKREEGGREGGKETSQYFHYTGDGSMLNSYLEHLVFKRARLDV